ncbi:MAG TPA: ABC transporter substrate-binding protein [Chloroflexota bacterium]|jgi:NitT/TauT family transport system substrate-binding protein|nr:ABC transporter substrate-binding protein [Chloroflexota bacterium]
MRTVVVVNLALALLILSGCAPAPTAPGAPAQAVPTPVPAALRWATIENASQAYIPVLLKDRGIAAKYGLELQVIGISNTGQQWNSLRSGDSDISSGSVLDLLRQRQAGLKARAISAFSTFGNPVVALASKPYTSLADLKGARVGTPNETLLDWMILRAAGKKTEGFDVGQTAQVQSAAPGLLNSLLDKGELDAALQFSDFTLGPLTRGTYKEVTTVPRAMAAAGLDPESFYLTWNLADAWRDSHPDSVPRLVAAIDEAVQLLETDDAVWPDLAKRSGVTDPQLLPAFVRMQRDSFRTTYTREKVQSTQALLDAITDTVGQSVVGVNSVDPAALDFDSSDAARKPRS